MHYLPGRRHVTAGVGGFADITAHAPEIVLVGSFTAGRRDIELTGSGDPELFAHGPISLSLGPRGRHPRLADAAERSADRVPTH